MRAKYISMLAIAAVSFTACNDDDDEDDPGTELTIPSEYIAPDYESNIATEAEVIAELSAFAGAANAAEANAGGVSTIDPIDYPGTLASVTLPSYRGLVEDWAVELVNAANSPTPFQIPDAGGPDPSEEGGLLGTRLLDEYGLELEQMLEKGSFGAALYNHAVALKNKENIAAADIDRLVEIFGAEPSFSPDLATASANYAKRRSNQTTQTGFLYEMRDNAITAKAAIQGGSEFNAIRNEALNNYLLNWEKSNFATVIYYCNAAKNGIQNALTIQDETERNIALGNAMHAYAEGVGFAHGFRGINEKLITDAQIDQILANLLAPEGENPESYLFLNQATLLNNFDQIIQDIQDIYGFSDAEVEGFYVNN
jgi:hypothetical protein